MSYAKSIHHLLFALPLAASVGLALPVTKTDAQNRPLTRAYLGKSDRPVAPLNAITQSMLRFMGYYQGAIDNRMGPNARNALKRYQSDRGLASTGQLNRNTLRRLRADIDARIKSRAGRSLNGKWARPGECQSDAFEIRDHMIVRESKDRISTPRLDFFELGTNRQFQPMIDTPRVPMLILADGRIAERRESQLKTPQHKPGALEAWRKQNDERAKAEALKAAEAEKVKQDALKKEKAAKEKAEAKKQVAGTPKAKEPRETVIMSADGTVLRVTKKQPEPGLQPPKDIDADQQARQSALDELKAALAELKALSEAETLPLDDSNRLSNQAAVPKPADPAKPAGPTKTAETETVKTEPKQVATEAKTADTAAPKETEPKAKEKALAGIGIKPTLKPAFQRETTHIGTLAYVKC